MKNTVVMTYANIRLYVHHYYYRNTIHSMHIDIIQSVYTLLHQLLHITFRQMSLIFILVRHTCCKTGFGFTCHYSTVLAAIDRMCPEWRVLRGKEQVPSSVSPTPTPRH